MSEKNNELRMTEGNIGKQILAFSLPLIIGNLFQQLYNTVDSVVVGQYVGKEALAAVGSSNSLINLLIGILTGIATGAGVIIAQYYGGKKEEKLSWAVHTAMTISILGGVLMIFLGIAASGPILRLMGTPESVMPNSTIYLRIFFLGSVFNLVYNIGSGILRAVGDSKNPLYYLTFASFVNIGLDLLFVIVFHMGVAGAAWATITAQAVSALLVLWKLMTCKAPYRIYLKKLRIDRIMAGRIIRFGVPAGLQNSIISLSNVIVQANINSFGDAAMAGCGAYNKVDGFVLLPVMSLSMAVMTFVGQNVGAGKYDRAKKGLWVTCGITMVYVIVVSVILFLFRTQAISLFSNDAEVIKNGVLMMIILMPFYWMISLVNICTGAFRGAGRSLMAMMVMVVNLCGIRMLWIWITVPMVPRLSTVLWGYPVSWITAFICCLFFMKGSWIQEYKPKRNDGGRK